MHWQCQCKASELEGTGGGALVLVQERPQLPQSGCLGLILADNFFWASRIVIRIRVTFWTRVLRNYARITNDAVYFARNGVRETCFGGHESSA